MKSKIPVIILCMVTLLCLGLIYGYSIFVKPLEAEFGWVRAETSLTFTISMITMCLGILSGGRFNNMKDKPFITLIAGAALIAAGFLMASKTQTILTFYIAYGVGVGFGVGLAYSQLISVGIRLIPGKQGMLSGILMMCFGLGALVLGSICNTLIAAIGWRQTFWFLGIIFGGLLVIMGLCLQLTCKNKEKTAQIMPDQVGDFTSTQMLASADFKFFYLWLITLSAAGLALMGHIAPCAMQIGATSSSAAFFAGLTSASNGIGRLLFGTAYDKFGVKRTVNYISVLFVAAAVIAAIAVSLASIPLLGIGCVLVGMSFGASPTSSSALAIRFYGPRFFSSNFGFITTHLILAAFLGPYLAGMLYTSSGTYVTTFYCVIGFSVASVILARLMLGFAKRRMPVL
ncbi:MAG: MFS transporter [Eubacteriales bacterium]|nr:MFS transporter [Eubacteriales bacterium]